MERQEFDSLLKNAFDRAEVSPSGEVWTNIELDLERARSGRMKRTLLFYKLVAAASLIFGLCIGGAALYVINDTSTETTLTSSVDQLEKVPADQALSNKKNSSKEFGSENESVTKNKSFTADQPVAPGNAEQALKSQPQTSVPQPKEKISTASLSASVTLPNGNNNSDEKGNASSNTEGNSINKLSDNTIAATQENVTSKQGVDSGEGNYDKVIEQTSKSKSKSQTSSSVAQTQEKISKSGGLNEKSYASNNTNGTPINNKSSDNNITSTRGNGSAVQGVGSEQGEKNYGTLADDNVTLAYAPESRLAYRNRKLPALMWTGKTQPFIPKIRPDKLDLLMASLEPEGQKEKKRRSSSEEKLWTSMGVSAGLFNTVNSSAGTAQSSLNFASLNSAATLNTNNRPSTLSRSTFYQESQSANNTLQNETKASGMAYSVGVQVGGKLAKRWVLQGGVNYITQNSEYTSTVVVEDHQNGNFYAATSSQFSKETSDDDNYYTTSHHEVNNNMQFVSVPVQAGFMVLNKAFGVQLNGGVSTDLFLQNTITPLAGGTLDKIKPKESKGKDSAYRSVNFSGLVGTELSYRVSDRYRVAVNPGVRYPFGSIYKSDVGLQSTPLTFDVGLKFRYIFN